MDLEDSVRHVHLIKEARAFDHPNLLDVGLTGFDPYSVAVIGAIVLLALSHMLFRRHSP